MTAAFFIKGQPVQIDHSDWPEVKKHSWHLHKAGRKSNPRYIPATRINGKRVLLHRLLLEIPCGMVIDHVNNNPLDNRRSNLRVCTQGENACNQRKFTRSCSSRYKGVYKANDGFFSASVQVKRERVHLGRFKSEIEAALSYDIAAVALFGEFARPNFTLLEAAIVHPTEFRAAIERCRAKGILPILQNSTPANQ